LYAQVTEAAERQLEEYYALVASCAPVTDDDVSPPGWAPHAEAEVGQTVPSADSALVELWASVLGPHRTAIATRLSARDAPDFGGLFTAPVY
jgi:hypothetical protein